MKKIRNSERIAFMPGVKLWHNLQNILFPYLLYAPTGIVSANPDHGDLVCALKTWSYARFLQYDADDAPRRTRGRSCEEDE